jgi:L-alanine-DL-glutamate epimerase-like enolase superfamily enzyme
VRSATVTTLRVPFPEPIADATHRLDVMDFIVLELTDDCGGLGFSYALGFDYASDVLAAMVVEAARHSIGTSPAERASTWTASWNRYEYVGRSGIAAWGLAAVDIALWDLYGVQTRQPIWALAGGAQRSVPIYGSGGWVSYSETELVSEAVDYLENGYGGYKMKVGRDVEDDVRRVKLVRARLGDAVPLMIDANQGYRFAEARQLADAVRDLGIEWFEEPMPSDRVSDYRSLRSASAVPLAGGERAYYPEGLAQFIAADALDVVMPDVLRIGGAGKWLEVASLAKSHGLAVAPHFYREFDAPLAAAIPNSSFVEGFRWTDDLFEWGAVIDGGRITPSAAPGFDVRLRPDARERYTRSRHQVSSVSRDAETRRLTR